MTMCDNNLPSDFCKNVYFVVRIWKQKQQLQHQIDNKRFIP